LAVVATPIVAAALFTTDVTGDRGFACAAAGGKGEDAESGGLTATEGPADTLAVEGAAGALGAELVGATWRVAAVVVAPGAGWFDSPVKVIDGDPPDLLDAAVSPAGPLTSPPLDTPRGVPGAPLRCTPTGGP
jgi:hypothetical protein